MLPLYIVNEGDSMGDFRTPDSGLLPLYTMSMDEIDVRASAGNHTSTTPYQRLHGSVG